MLKTFMTSGKFTFWPEFKTWIIFQSIQIKSTLFNEL